MGFGKKKGGGKSTESSTATPRSGAAEDCDDDLCPDAPSAGSAKDSGLTHKLQQLMSEESKAHEITKNELAVERAAHDETAEKMVELQHRLEVTLQELANLERFVKMQQPVKKPTVPGGDKAAAAALERLMREESYLKSRLAYVQQEIAASQGGVPEGAEGAPSSNGPPAAKDPLMGSDGGELGI